MFKFAAKGTFTTRVVVRVPLGDDKHEKIECKATFRLPNDDERKALVENLKDPAGITTDSALLRDYLDDFSIPGESGAGEVTKAKEGALEHLLEGKDPVLYYYRAAFVLKFLQDISYSGGVARKN